MGNWCITIQGIGAHHNRDANDAQYDANLMANRFVCDLRKAGHHIESASFTFGCKENLLPRIDGIDKSDSEKVAILRDALISLVGVSSVQDLDAMEAVVKKHAVIDDDKKNCLKAIQAIRSTN